MPRLKIDWNAGWNGYPMEWNLNDKWTFELRGSSTIANQIQIKRQSYDTFDAVSVYLEILEIFHGDRRIIFKKEFSKLFSPQFKNLDIENISLYHRSLSKQYWFKGYVDIAENIKIDFDGIQNEQFPEINQPKSRENSEPNIRVLQKSLNQLSYDFERLLDQKTSSLSDVTLKCGDVAIPAHKIILSARSPVFAAMFANPMKENIKNEVDISDIDLNTVRSLLKYIYTGKTSDLIDSSAEDLLLAADKYQLQGLKSACVDILKDTLSMQNVLRILVLGDMIDSDLKAIAVDYICSNCAEFAALEKTEEWNSLQKNNPALSMEILTSMVKSMNEKLKIPKN